MDTLFGWPMVETDVFESNSVPAKITFTNWGCYTGRIKIEGKVENGVITFKKPGDMDDAEWDAIIDALAKSAGSLE